MIRFFTLLLAFIISGNTFGVSNAMQTDDQFKPVSVGDGPLLFLYKVEDIKGKPGSDDDLRVHQLCVLDPQIHRTPNLIWKSPNAPLVRPVARLKDGAVVMSHGDRNFLLDVKTGTTSTLLASTPHTDVVAVNENQVYFVAHHDRKQLNDSSPDSKQTAPTDNGSKAPRTRDILYVLDRSISDTAKRLSDVEIETILSEDVENFWIVTSPDSKGNRNVCKISKKGGTEQIVPFPTGWMASVALFHLSPNQSRFTLSSAHEDHDIHDEQQLIIVNIEERKIVYRKTGIKTSFPMFGGFPYIWAIWLDDNVVCIERQTIDSSTGKEPTNVPTSRFPIATNDTESPESDRETIGFFDLKHGEAFYKGNPNPVASVLDSSGVHIRDLAVDRNGHWVAFVSPKNGNLWLVDGKAQQKRILSTDWCTNVEWLPIQYHNRHR